MDFVELRIVPAVGQTVIASRLRRIKMNKEEQMAELIERIRLLVKQEERLLLHASKKGCEAAMLRAKEEALLYKARQCEGERYRLSLEYNRLKNPCPKILAEVETKLQRRLTVDEIFEIERMYAAKITKRTAVTAH
jgi:hypothetical protein